MIVKFSLAYTLQSDGEINGESQAEETDECESEVCLPGPAYKRLIAIHAGKPKGGLKEALKIEVEKVRRLSLSEQALEKAAEFHGTDVVRYECHNDNLLFLLLYLFFPPI